MDNDLQKAVVTPASTTSDPDPAKAAVSPTAQQAAGALAAQRIAGSSPAAPSGKQPGGTQKALHVLELLLGTGTGPTIDGVGVAAGGQTAPQPVAAASSSGKKKSGGGGSSTSTADPTAVDPTKKPAETLATFKDGGLNGTVTSTQSGSGEVDDIGVKDGKLSADAVGTATNAPAGAFKVGYAPSKTAALSASVDGVGTANRTESVEADYKPAGAFSADAKAKFDSTGVTAVADGIAKKGSFTTTATAGIDHDNPDAALDVKRAPKGGGVGFDVNGATNAKAQGITGKVSETSKDGRFDVGLQGGIDATKGPTVGGNLDFTNKSKTDGIHISVTSGPTGLNASVAATVGSVTFGVVMRNTSLVTVTLDLGPKHPVLNEIIRDALTAASAVAQPIPFGVGLGVRLFGSLLKKKKKATTPAATATGPAANAPAAATPSVAPAAAPATAAAVIPGASEPVAIILPEDFAGLQTGGAITPEGTLNAGVDPDKFAASLAGAALDSTQQAGLTSAYTTAHVASPTGSGADPAGDDEHAPS